MVKVYVVEDGWYSSRHVVGVFSEERKADAETLANSCKCQCECTEFELDHLRFVDPGKSFWHVEMKRDGRVVSLCEYDLLNLDDIGEDGVVPPNEPDAECRLKTVGTRKWRLHWTGQADSDEHAVKIVNEIRAELLAGHVRPGVVVEAK